MIFHGSLSILFPRDMKHLLFIRVHLKFISCSCVPVNFKLLLSSKKSLKDKERSTGFITVTTLKIKIEEFYNLLLSYYFPEITHKIFSGERRVRYEMEGSYGSVSHIILRVRVKVNAGIKNRYKMIFSNNYYYILRVVDPVKRVCRCPCLRYIEV